MTQAPSEDPHTRYEVCDPREIRQLLQRLIQARALLTVNHDDGQILLLSSVLGFDDHAGNLLLDTSARQDINVRVLAQAQLHCVGNLDNIEVRFSLGQLALGMHEQLPAFSVPMPERLIYLQRREYYRLLAPAADALECEIELPAEQVRAPRILRAPVIDLSARGIAIRVPSDEDSHFQAGVYFARSRLALPNTGAIESGLHIRHVREQTDRKGRTWQLAGCEWDQLSMAMQAIGQRYIMRVERERLARERGLL